MTSVDLPAPERPTRPTFSPGRMVSDRFSMIAALPAVVEGDVLEADLALGDLQLGTAPGASTRSCGRAIVSMPSCTAPTLSKMPIDVHMIQPDMVAMRMARPLAMVIAPSGQAAVAHSQTHSAVDAGDEQAVQRHHRAAHHRDQPRRGAELAGVVGDRVARVVVLARGVREELHRLDVGVAVDDAAGQHRARLRHDGRAARGCAARRSRQHGDERRRSRRSAAASAASRAARRGPAS